jgi:hypothetical protein
MPPGSAVQQGTVYQNGQIDKYDIVGFAAMRVDHVYGPNDAAVQGTPAQDWPCSGKSQNGGIASGTYTWSAFASMLTGNCSLPPAADSVKSVTIAGQSSPNDYIYDTTGITVKTAIPKQTDVAFTLHTNQVLGDCGDPSQYTTNNSAVCIVLTWQGSTLTGDYPSDRLDDITIVRLCDLDYNSCLDQRPR